MEILVYHLIDSRFFDDVVTNMKQLHHVATLKCEQPQVMLESDIKQALEHAWYLTNTIGRPWPENKSATFIPQQSTPANPFHKLYDPVNEPHPFRSSATGDVMKVQYDGGLVEWWQVAFIGFRRIEKPAQEK